MFRPLQPAGTLPTVVKQEPLSQYYSQPPPYVKPKPSTSSKAEVTALAFDILGGNGDRYLLPKNSTVQYHAGNTQALVSFLVTRKGSDAAGGRYKPNAFYYQPVAVRLRSHHPRILELVGKVVASPNDVRRHMADIMQRMTPANRVFLAMRLPHSADKAPDEEYDAEGEARADGDIPMDSYEAPSSLLPLRISMVANS